MIYLNTVRYYLAGSAGAGLGGAGERGRGRATETGRAPGTSPCSLAPATQTIEIIYSWLIRVKSAIRDVYPVR